MKQSGFGHYDSFGHPFKTKTACCDVNKLLRGVACSIRLVFLSVNTGRPHMTSSWIYRKGSVSEEIRKPLVYTITGELQNSYSLWFSEVAVAVVTCCLRWYFHVIGKENRKAACDLILYKVKGMSLTRKPWVTTETGKWRNSYLHWFSLPVFSMHPTDLMLESLRLAFEVKRYHVGGLH